jgi:alkanesulfonate monooxygenase SsuD/methylene tetrahydromethanopterin reductase-like flavin-dependent oxidoreductase (luciferase family)
MLANSLLADDMDMALATIEAGAESAGRTLDDIEVWGMANLIFAPSEHDGLDDFLAELGGSSPLRRSRLDCPDAPDHVRHRIEALEQTHDRYIHDSTSTLVLERQDVTCRTTIAGPPEACVERLLELSERGLTHLILPQVMADREEWMRTFANEVLPFVT